MNPKIRQNLFPVLAAFIWGTAFVAQSVSSDYIPPFTFNLLRSLVAAVVLVVQVLPVLTTALFLPLQASRLVLTLHSNSIGI